MRYPDVIDAIVARKSVRAFTSQSVDRETVGSILELASRAPSGTNIQPWRVYVVGSPQIAQISAAIVGPDGTPAPEEWDDYKYYPDDWFEPYLGRRRANAMDLYRSLEIGRKDKDKYTTFINQNYAFFGAPVGLIVTLDRRLEKGAWVDLGMFLQNVLLLATAHGLDSCPQASFAPYHRFIRPILGIPDADVVVCGIALGHANRDHPSYQMQTDRAPLAEWVFGL